MKVLHGFKKVLYPASLILFCLIMCMFVSCNNDDEEPSPADLLVGKWTISSTTMDLAFDNKNLVQYLVDELGLSQLEATAFNDMLEDALLEFFVGTIDFKQDHTYTINMGGETDSGTWSLSADGQTLTLDADTIDETEAMIISLNSSTLAIEMTQHAEEDLDEDGITEQLIMKISMTLNK